MERLWAPWRLEYVAAEERPPGCIFCAMLEQDDATALVVQRSESCFVVLNRYPYGHAHLMVAPRRHVGQPAELHAAERAELWELMSQSLAALASAYGPDGYNTGLNLGRAAGAGVEGHLHVHVVPRWSGDTNFMPVLADVRVMPQHLASTWRALRDAWPGG